MFKRQPVALIAKKKEIYDEMKEEDKIPNNLSQEFITNRLLMRTIMNESLKNKLSPSISNSDRKSPMHTQQYKCK